MALAERGLVVAKGRVTAGKSSPVETTRAQVQVSQIRLELNRAQIGLSDAYRRLAASTGSATPDFQDVAAQSQSAPPLPAAAQLLARLEQTTELRLADLHIIQSEASVGLEKAQRIPDLDVSIGSQYDASVRERVNLVGVSMPIPLFNRNQGNVLAASRRADQARDLRNAVELRLRTETRHGAGPVANRRYRSARIQPTHPARRPERGGQRHPWLRDGQVQLPRRARRPAHLDRSPHPIPGGDRSGDRRLGAHRTDLRRPRPVLIFSGVFYEA